MKIKKTLAHVDSSSMNAVIETYKGLTEIKIGKRTDCVLASSNWDKRIALKDITYDIVDGVFYISGTRYFYFSFDDIFKPIYLWGRRSLYTIDETVNSKLVEPFVEEDLIIHRWWWKNKKIKGIDFTDKEIPSYYLIKFNSPYSVAISNFKLIENE